MLTKRIPTDLQAAVHRRTGRRLEPQADPVMAKATGSLHFEVPVAQLDASFTSIWVHRMDAASAPPVLITPDATVDLQWIGGRFRVAGPDREPQVEVLAPGETVIGFRFRPAVAAAWLGVPLVELQNKRVPLEDLWGQRARRLAGRVPHAAHLPELLSTLQAAVAGDVGALASNAPMSAAYAFIDNGTPPEAQLVPWLMRTLQMSERTLRRRFNEHFGYGPKTLARILRYQRYQRLASRSAGPVAGLASEAGYADQAHLLRECRRLTGSTPRQIDRSLAGT